MKIITWNVNSVRTRLERVSALMAREAPDALCLQETKVKEDDFPREPFERAGYMCFVNGQKSYNGVAILLRRDKFASTPDEEKRLRAEVQRGFPGDPAPQQARVLSLVLGDLRLINVYVVNGKELGHEYYDLKLRWLDALCSWIAGLLDSEGEPVVCGDFNIAPEERDVHDTEKWSDRVLCSEPERERLACLKSLGLLDLHRSYTQDEGIYTWWDYRQGAFARNWGLRIDLFLGTGSIANRIESVRVDRDERKKTSGPGKPSDHAPVILTLRKN